MPLKPLPTSTDLGLLVLRLWLGLVGALHGSQKLFGAFDGHGIEAFAGFLKKLNIPAPTSSAYMAALAEFGGGLLIALGIVPRLAAVPFAFTMIVAWATAHHGKFFGPEGGEYALALAAMAIAIIIAGPGKWTVIRSPKGV